jgi:NAD(P)-dependent dehydrogenase (short-subunit alcohol dehydrogenase family)
MGILTGKVAIVTGASRGMGQHFVAALAGAGAQVVALARPSTELDSLGADNSDAVLAIPCDVANAAQVSAAVSQAVAHFGRIDLIVNNAAVFWPFMLEEASDLDVERHFAVNVLGPIWLMRACIPHLKVSKGQIVSVTSESVRHPFPMLTVYAATKAALETLSAGLRDELQADGIRVTVLRSGSVAGSTADINWDPARTEAFYRKILSTGHAHMAGEAATPESMAQALLAIATLPPDVNADLIEVRAARAGMPDGAKAFAGQDGHSTLPEGQIS